ncbi:MAG: flavin reductase family protein [Pseudomonadota bacterium]|jgi:flavin reductase (DIM6/NTAB) family NADH-FMN oxidoreductase RutF
MQTRKIAARSLYYGTPVALVSTRSADGTDNLAPMSSSWSLRSSVVLGMGAASATVENLRARPELVLNLPSADMWNQVEAISAFTGRSDLPAHKAGQFAFSPDKFAVAGLTRQPSETVAPVRVSECPIQLEAVVESMVPVADEPEGFVVVVATIKVAHVHDDILTADQSAIDPDKWTPLIFNFRSYRGLTATLGTMRRTVRR